jgi:hypothetical protein
MLCNLQDGGFGAYVAASHACSRHGLYIMQPVSIQDLNKPMPYSLLQETKRLQTIEHNTYICYGFIKAQYQVIPDPESETNMDKTSFTPIFNIISNTQSKKTNEDNQTMFQQQFSNFDLPKCKPIDSHSNSCSIVNQNSDVKHQRIDCSTSVPQSQPCENSNTISAGCTWSTTNWSCAYDCAVMSIFYAYLTFTNTVKLLWSEETPLTNILNPLFQELTSSRKNMMSTTSFNIVRDHVRDYLSNCNTVIFPRFRP